MIPHCTFFMLWLVIAIANTVVGRDCPADREAINHYEAKLQKDLFCDYDYDVRPVKEHTSTVKVSVRFAIKYISFDSLEETFTLHSWVAMAWKDEYLKWAPSEYGNIKEIQIESHQIWTPKMALFNADASMYQSDQIYTTCMTTYDGNVTCVPHLAHSGICRTSLQRWPYDQQNCTFLFGSWMNTGEQVNFTFYQHEPVILDDFQNGPGWILLHVINERLPGKYNCCPNKTYPMLKYTFILKRLDAGPAAIVVVPSVVIVLLTLISLLLDVKDNTRLILICFSLYGHFMFLTEIGYEIPKHSADTPIIILFLRDSMVVTLFGILETLFLKYLRGRVAPAPSWIVSINRLVSSGPGKYVVFTEFDPSDVADSKESYEENSEANERTPRAALDWIQIANLLNSALFIIAVLVYLVLIGTYMPRDS